MRDLDLFIFVIICLASSMMISSLVILIQFWHSLDGFVLVCAVIICGATFICMNAICKFASRLTKLSLEFPKSYLRSGRKLPKESLLRFKACRPLWIPIGSFMILSEMTFPMVIKEVVAETVISILLMLT